MKLFDNQLTIFEQTVQYKYSHKLDTVLLAWHSNKSITWSWAFYYFHPFKFHFARQKFMLRD